MAKEKVVSIWDNLDGAKEGLKDEVTLDFGGDEYNIPVQFKDLDEVQDINEIYDEKKSSRPVIQVPYKGGTMNLKVPTSDEKYERFNTHKKAQEWEEENKKFDKRKNYHLAYLFIADDKKPSDDAEEGVEMLMDRLRYVDVLKIVNKGFELNGFNEQLGEQNADS